MSYGIIDSQSHRLIAFCSHDILIQDCYTVANLIPDEDLIGQKYNNGSWEYSVEPFTSQYAIELGRNNV
jgi:hypothetical protein